MNAGGENFLSVLEAMERTCLEARENADESVDITAVGGCVGLEREREMWNRADVAVSM